METKDIFIIISVTPLLGFSLSNVDIFSFKSIKLIKDAHITTRYKSIEYSGKFFFDC